MTFTGGKRLSLLILALWAGPVLWADQVFTINNTSDPATLDPAFAVGVPEQNVFLALFEGLTTLDSKTLEPLPGVAKNWKVTDGGRHYTFTLRQDAFWSHSRPVYAGDFVFAWRRLLDPETDSPNASYLFTIKGARDFHNRKIQDFNAVGIRAIGKYTLEVDLENPTPYFLFLTAFYALAPLPVDRFNELGSRFWVPNNLVTNGPFRLESWQKKDKLTVVRNLGYWDTDTVQLERVVFLPIQDEKQVVEFYRAGKILWTGRSALPADQIETLRRRHDYFAPSQMATYFLRLNLNKPPLDNPDVRRALFLAMDSKSVVAQSGGEEKPTQSLVPKDIGGYPAPAIPAFNPKRAQQFLRQAGYCTRVNPAPSCKVFPTLEMLYNSDTRHRNILAVISQLWSENLGIPPIKPKGLEWALYLREQQHQRFQISRSGWIADYPDPLAFLEIFSQGNDYNNTGWSNPRFDDLLKSARTEVDPERRLKILSEAEALLMRDVPIIPIFNYSAPYLLDPKVAGFYPNAHDLHPYKTIYIKGSVTAENSPRTPTPRTSP